jgi:DNA-binding protein HU-beta
MTTKAEFVDKVAAKSGLSKKDAGAAVDAVISSIEDSLQAGDEVSFTGFGKFHVAERGARQGRNPRTGQSIYIAASRVPRFTAGAKLKQAVKG